MIAIGIGHQPLDGVLSANHKNIKCEFKIGILNRNLTAGGENSIQRRFYFLRKYQKGQFQFVYKR